MATALLDDSNETGIELESTSANIVIENTHPDTQTETTPPPIILDPIPSINNINNTNNNNDPDIYHAQFIQLKKHVKGKRKSTFCCIFSCGALIITIVLLLAPLSTEMIDDWRLYNNSIHAQCKLLSSNPANNTLNNNTLNNNICYYKYERIDGYKFNDKCNNKMHEYTSCDKKSQINNEKK
eukprot:72998_1